MINTNLYSLLKNPFQKNVYLDEELAYKIFYNCLILGDDFVDLEIESLNRIIEKLEKEGDEDSLEEIKLWNKFKDKTKKGRKISCGFMALGDFYATLNVPYGDIDITTKLMKIKLKAELDASTDLAIIRGSFPEYDLSNEYETRETYGEYLISGNNDWYQFLLTEFPKEVKRMMIYGRRNVTWSSIPPTGTSAILTQTTSGIEPLFFPFYKRRVKVFRDNEHYDVIDVDGSKFREEYVIHDKLKEFAKINSEVALQPFDGSSNVDWQRVYEQSPYYKQCANDLDIEVRTKTQSLINKYICSSISSTVNLPSTATLDDIQKVYLSAYNNGTKGITLYVDGSKGGVLLSTDKKKDDPCKDFITHSAPKRPKTLNADFYKIKYKSQNYIIIVGLYCDKPYELFCFVPTLENIELKTLFNKIKEHTGIITKVNKNLYKFDSDYITIPNLTEFNSEEEKRHCTRTSLELRHGIGLEYIIKTFKKYDDNITSFSSVCARILSKYTNKENKTGEVCPDCGEKLIHEGGCTLCPNCSYSKCS